MDAPTLTPRGTKMNYLLLSIGLMLMMVLAVNCKRIRRTLTHLWPDDYVDRIALVMAMGVPGMVLLNWSWY